MMPSEIREELLSQHESLRGLLEAAHLAILRWAGGEMPRIAVREELVELSEALRKHNLREESALWEHLLAIDAWGPARLEIMAEAHIREHHDILQAIFAVGDVQDAHEGVSALDRLRTHLLEHMAREEETFLNASVLRDDDGAPDEQESG